MNAGVLHLGSNPAVTFCGKGGLVLLESSAGVSPLEDDTREGVLILCRDCQRQLLVRAALDLMTTEGIRAAADLLAEAGRVGVL